jgi:hypothetical protein
VLECDGATLAEDEAEAEVEAKAEADAVTKAAAAGAALQNTALVADVADAADAEDAAEDEDVAAVILPPKALLRPRSSALKAHVTVTIAANAKIVTNMAIFVVDFSRSACERTLPAITRRSTSAGVLCAMSSGLAILLDYQTLQDVNAFVD